MVEKINENIYRIVVELPRSPLKTLNSYVLTSPEGNILIDTGFNQPECLEMLRSGIGELGIDMEKTDILATHFHADHTGLISRIKGKNAKVYMGEVDKALLLETITQPKIYWKEREDAYIAQGYAREELQDAHLTNPARKYVTDDIFEITGLKDGDRLPFSAADWRVIDTPGHTPGHICLYNGESRVMITGDHVLFDITPNITCWRTMPDALGSYLDSLRKIRPYEVDVTLTGHRQNIGGFKERIDQLLAHHEARLNEVADIVAAQPGLNGEQIASRMKWSIRVKSWQEFPPQQKWFAVGEAIAHIDHLLVQGRLERSQVDGVFAYRVKGA